MILDGKMTSETIKRDVADEIKRLGITPKLAVVLVGERPDSKIYVSRKETVCKEIGIESLVVRVPETISQDELIKVVQLLNQDITVHGILVQLSLPSHIDEHAIILSIDPMKDVDCFHPTNIGLMAIGKPYTMPCTPYGVIKLLERYTVPISGKKAVVIGRSNIVGKPMAMLLTQKNATVTILHTKTPRDMMTKELQNADIIVSAVGKPNWLDSKIYIPTNYVQTLVDVGINFVNGKMVGDIEESFKKRAFAYTPVPGGVGQMTVATLLENCLLCCKTQLNL